MPMRQFAEAERGPDGFTGPCPADASGVASDVSDDNRMGPWLTEDLTAPMTHENVTGRKHGEQRPEIGRP